MSKQAEKAGEAAPSHDGNHSLPYERKQMMAKLQLLALAAAGAALLICRPGLAASKCEFKDPGKAFSVQGSVVYVDAANATVAELGYSKVVAINDSKRGCVAYVQAKRVLGCAKGKTASASGSAFVVPFTPVILAGADSVECK